MKKRYLPAVILPLLLVITAFFSNKPQDPLAACKKQLQKNGNAFLELSFQENRNEHYHSLRPWQQLHFEFAGTVHVNETTFQKADTLLKFNGNTQLLTGALQYDQHQLLLRDYGDTALTQVTKEMYAEQPLENARYSPLLLVQLFRPQRPLLDGDFSVYRDTIGTSQAKLFIRRSDCTVDRLVTLRDDDVYGDVRDTIYYRNYAPCGNYPVPRLIAIHRTNGKLCDTIRISAARWVSTSPSPVKAPEKFTWAKSPDRVADTAIAQNFSPHIHFVLLPQAQSRSLVVEFRDFLLIAEAPENGKNGELLLQEARRIAPGKPVKYFVAGHYHPSYLGGVRPFIHAGATIIARDSTIDYLRYVAGSAHTVRPDSLQLDPRPLKTEMVRDSLVISDGSYSMCIYLIGAESEHTVDYLLYYFPSEKMLFEDDLARIPAKGEMRKAGKLQRGLYHAILERKLAPETIVQSWPLGEAYDMKTIFTFSELEQSVKMQ